MKSIPTFKGYHATSRSEDRLNDPLPDQFRFALATMRVHKDEQAPSLSFWYGQRISVLNLLYKIPDLLAPPYARRSNSPIQSWAFSTPAGTSPSSFHSFEEIPSDEDLMAKIDTRRAPSGPILADADRQLR